MRRIFWMLLTLGALVWAQGTPSAHAHGPSEGPLQAQGLWVRYVSGNTAALFGTFFNSGPAPIRILGFRSPVAAKSELHQTRMDPNTGVARMEPVEAYLLAPRARLELRPGGYHGMLMGLKRPLKLGEVILVEVLLEGDKVLPLQVPVRLDPPKP